MFGVIPGSAEISAPRVFYRHIAPYGQPSFRDLGGYATAERRSVKWGQVFRSGELPRRRDSDEARLGFAYDFHLEKSTIAPAVNIDILDGEQIYVLGVGRGS